MSTKRNLSVMRYMALLAAGFIMFYFSKIIGLVFILMAGYGILMQRDDT